VSERTIEVGLGVRAYPIRIGRGTLAHAGEIVARDAARHAVIVTNPIVARHWLAPLQAALSGVRTDVIEIADGESHKDLATLDRVITRLLELRAERRTMVVALGGGVVGDVAGFAAAVYQRGIPFIQVPTTLLAQVDSSVGGKTGINHPLGKNMIGAFYQPRAVLIDTDCLGTLPPREFAAGLAEVVKYGAIADAAFFAWLEGNVDALVARDADALVHAIEVSCRTKAAIVAADEREEGERALLNFGHTFGHAIENGVGYGEWLHGEAVAAGMAVAAEVSRRTGRIDARAVARLRTLLTRAGLPVDPPALGFDAWMALMSRDKKVRAGSIRFVLLDAIGRAVLTSDVPEPVLRAVLS
jgi:3-dehydroquinate synthase